VTELSGRWFFLRPADLEIGDTAGFETCETILSPALCPNEPNKKD
jgi:hypothetical protein